MSIIKKLQAIQSELEVPKSQYNSFGKYHYRNAEDILAAAKPISIKHDCLLTVTDDMVVLNDRFYVKAVARLDHNEEHKETTAYAREELTKKGMDASQITGSASSYARKYALNGLFCLDDVKDPDATNKGNGNDKPESTRNKTASGNGLNDKLKDIKANADSLGMTKDDLRAKMEEMFDVKKSTDLTMEQAEKLNNKILEEMEEI